MIKILSQHLIVLINVLFFSDTVFSKTYKFKNGLEDWSTWGDGVSKHDRRIGRGSSKSNKGSLWLTSDFGKEHTAYLEKKNLKPGNYKVRFFIRGVDLSQEGIWHFIDRGQGTETIFRGRPKKEGSWEKVEYTIEVKGGDLGLWVRLISYGQIWIDDFSIIKTSGKVKNVSRKLIRERKKLKPKRNSTKRMCVREGLHWGSKHKYCPKCGGDFASNSTPKVASTKAKSKIIKIPKSEFHNFNPSNFENGDWRKYNRISLEVYNPERENIEFTLVVGDGRSHNYWSQLNHTARLSPGWNNLNLSLTRYVGERGSVRYYRGINLKDIQKFFVIADQDKKYQKTSSAKFQIKNIQLSYIDYPKKPRSVWAFDFTNVKSTPINGMTPVLSAHGYTRNRGHGFKGAKLWRVENSVYASRLQKTSIGILNGEFLVNVPDGEYEGELLIERLGYWSPAYWSNRSVDLNGESLLLENRDFEKYLSDVLRFSKIEPEVDSHPYDLYLKNILNPIKFSTKVKNGKLRFSFYGDATGINLNYLIFWKKKDSAIAENYLARLEDHQRKEFDWLSRNTQLGSSSKSKIKNESKLIKSHLKMGDVKDSVLSKKTIELIGGQDERPYQIVYLPPGFNGNISIESKSDAPKINLFEVVYQYGSEDLNHETFTLVGKYLRPLRGDGKVSPHSLGRYLWVQTEFNEKTAPGVFNAKLNIKGTKLKETYPIKIQVLDYILPKVKFPVGLFGLQPLTELYFSGSIKNNYQKSQREKVLKLISTLGFTTYTGLPSVLNGDVIDTNELDALFFLGKKLGMGDTVFSYGGEFPQDILNSNLDIESKKSFFKLMGQNKTWPKIVYTYSDEASGYSNKVNSDLEKAEKLKKDYPALLIGGFTQVGSGKVDELNSKFDFGFYSHLKKSKMKSLEGAGKKWGAYNGSSGAFEDPRFSFGIGLYHGRRSGLAHYLDWHLSAFQNYPYYDLDGREGDIAMVFPQPDGSIYRGVKLELVSEGLNQYRKIKLLEQIVGSGEGSKVALKDAKKILKEIRATNGFWKSGYYMAKRGMDFYGINFKINKVLSRLRP